MASLVFPHANTKDGENNKQHTKKRKKSNKLWFVVLPADTFTVDRLSGVWEISQVSNLGRRVDISGFDGEIFGRTSSSDERINHSAVFHAGQVRRRQYKRSIASKRGVDGIDNKSYFKF